MMNLPTYWRSNAGDILSEDTLIEWITCYPDHRITVLDGYYGYQQHQIIRRLSNGDTGVMSAEELGNEILTACQHPGNMQKYLETTLRSTGSLLCIEDIEFFRGKHATIEILIQCFSSISKGTKIILTGNQLALLTPEFLKQLDCAYFQLCGDHLQNTYGKDR